MKRHLFTLLTMSICLSACITSKVKSLGEVNSVELDNSSSVKIFLLERDVPQDIKRLGVVSLSVNSRPGLNVDEDVKRQLIKNCQQLGANGAYRINDGTYYPMIVSYLVFRYEK